MIMVYDFSSEYAKRSDDELLFLAGHRASLTREAAAALDAELGRRHLTEADRAEYQRSVHRMERREYRSQRPRKLFGKGHISWHEMLAAFGAMALISFSYLALPHRYHLTPEWEDAAACVMIASVVIVVAWRNLWRDIAFWMALMLSSIAQLTLVHAWIERGGGNLANRGFGKAATFLGFLFWVAIYGIVWLLRRKSQRQPKQTDGERVAIFSDENRKQNDLTHSSVR